jgi:hypothetical protein
MTQPLTGVNWAAIPLRQPRRLIALVGQRAYRRLSLTATEDRSDERHRGFTPERGRQDSRLPPRPPGGGVGTPVNGAAGRTASGVDAVAVRLG